MKNKNGDNEKTYSTFKRTKSIKTGTSVRNKDKNIWRSTSLANIVNYSRMRKNSSVLSSRGPAEPKNAEPKTNMSSVSPSSVMSRKLENKVSGISRNSVVSIIVVKAKGLPPVPEDGETHKLYCKFRLGSETYKTKAVISTVQPEWGERFILRTHKDSFLKISIWDKGKQKIFMGSSILDLSSLEKERTQEIWQQLDDGYGLIHFSVTICSSSSNKSSLTPALFNKEDVENTQDIYDLRSSWELVGLLQVNILEARGLVGKLSAYCVLELDNERVQTPGEGPSSEPTWNRCYIFRVYDVTSTLDLKVYGRSFTSALLYEPIGKVSIPLLTIANGEQRWYALKDRNKKYIAKGNCPRVHLQMSLIWNPIKASLRVFRPKPVKYVKKSKKYDVARIYSNIEFIGELFEFLYNINEGFKRLFEWDDREASLVALSSWLVFCYYLRLWTVPLLLLIPFAYHWFNHRSRDNKLYNLRTNSNTLDGANKNNIKTDKNLSGKVQDAQHTTVVVLSGVEYIASLTEKLNNLICFKVPFLSYIIMILLAIASLIFYFVPFNYLLMILGIYKYARKYLNPDRVLNNDLIDFLSRIPNNRTLKEWKELSVPEPLQKQFSGKLARSISSETLPL